MLTCWDPKVMWSQINAQSHVVMCFRLFFFPVVMSSSVFKLEVCFINGCRKVILWSQAGPDYWQSMASSLFEQQSEGKWWDLKIYVTYDPQMWWPEKVLILLKSPYFLPSNNQTRQVLNSNSCTASFDYHSSHPFANLKVSLQTSPWALVVNQQKYMELCFTNSPRRFPLSSMLFRHG